jgi:hypothetical protein
MESGWDPEVKKFFRKIINSISLGLLWLMAMVTAGIYFQLGFFDGRPIIYTILFYLVLVITLLLLLRYFQRTWKK